MSENCSEHIQNSTMIPFVECVNTCKSTDNSDCRGYGSELNLLIIIGIESFLLCAFVALSIYLYLNKRQSSGSKVRKVEGITNQTLEEGNHYVNPSEPQLMHYETVISASRRSSINSENPYEIIVNNRNNEMRNQDSSNNRGIDETNAEQRSIESNNNVLNRSYENLAEEEEARKQAPSIMVIDCKKLEPVPMIIDSSEIF